jgi:hypothetical protein
MARIFMVVAPDQEIGAAAVNRIGKIGIGFFSG